MEALKNQDIEAIDKAMAELNSVWQKASEEMYKASQAAEADKNRPQDEASSKKGKDSKGDDDEVTDVDFEEVK